MRKILLLLFTCVIYTVHAQTFVSTTPENKNIILEEFTGISCGFCPDGHLIGQNLHDANPNDVFLINIHTGGYATPQGPGTDFNTSFGSAIANQSGLSGYPAGTVNRHKFAMTQGGGTAMSRGDWAVASTQMLSESSPVNIGVQANVDMATNILTVDVEVYYTGTQTVTSNMLNIAVVQNGILGPQSGGATYNPAAIDPATGLYTHNHMLRHMLTGQWGNSITNITQGTLYSDQFTWTMPADIAGVVLDPTNIAIVAFVSEGQQEILSGTEVYPNIVFANSYDAYCMSSSASNIVCAPETDLTVTFRNYGNIPLTSLDIDYSINGGPTTNYPWTGSVPSAGTETVTIPGVSVIPGVTNTVSFTLSNPNGNTDQNPGNNSSTASFAGLMSASDGTATIDVTTDQYANETSWILRDDNGTIIASASAGSMTNSSPQPTAYATLAPNTCYSFTIYDSYGDGIFSPGGYTFTDANGSVIASMAQLGAFTTEQQTNFETSSSGPIDSWDCDPVQGCYDPGTGLGQYPTLAGCNAVCNVNSVNDFNKSFSIYPNPVKSILNINGIYTSLDIYDAYGKLVLSSNDQETINVESLSSGVYFVNVHLEETIIVQKITVTK